MSVATKNGPEPDTRRERDLPGHGKAGEKFRVVGCMRSPTQKTKAPHGAYPPRSLSRFSLGLIGE